MPASRLIAVPLLLLVINNAPPAGAESPVTPCPAEVTLIDTGLGAAVVNARPADEIATGAAPGDVCVIALPAGPVVALPRTSPDQYTAVVSSTPRLPHAVWRVGSLAAQPDPNAPARAWHIAHDAARHWLPAWPIDATIHARIESLGPGAATVWLTIGADSGVAAGDRFVALGSGQPLAALTAEYVTPAAAFCRVRPLVDDPRLRPGQRVQRSPTPASVRLDYECTRVSHIEPLDGGQQRIWIPAVRATAGFDEHVDFFDRDGHFIAWGTVEDANGTFWYVRTTGVAAASDEEGAADKQVTVGDRAVLRSRRDLTERRFAARVFSVGPGEILINAGETAGLGVGDIGRIHDDDAQVGEVRIERVQRTYARVQVEQGPIPDVGTRIWFGPPPEPERVVGQLTRVGPSVALASRLESAPDPPDGRLLSVRSGPATVAVAVVLQTRAGELVLFIPPASHTADLEAGMLLIDRAQPLR